MFVHVALYLDSVKWPSVSVGSVGDEISRGMGPRNPNRVTIIHSIAV